MVLLFPHCSGVYVLCACFVVRVLCLWQFSFFFFLMIRRPPRSTLDRSSAASDVYKRQGFSATLFVYSDFIGTRDGLSWAQLQEMAASGVIAVSYTHLRAHETVLDLVCRLLLEKKTHKHRPVHDARHNKSSVALRTQASHTQAHAQTHAGNMLH